MTRCVTYKAHEHLWKVGIFCRIFFWGKIQMEAKLSVQFVFSERLIV